MERLTRVALFLAVIGNSLGFSPITVTTRTVLPNQSPDTVQDFLASPGNWPKIVSSSVGVSSDQDVSKPLPVGKTVDEIFGLPPIIPLSVTWTRTRSKNQRLEFYSPQGLEGVAEQCEMLFDIQSPPNNSNSQETDVVLTMKYQPVSILAELAVPILTLDNTVALQFLLPAAMNQNPELDKFRNLMGGLYGVAGLAHLADCVGGDSQLLTMAGAPPFAMLPLTGQIYALLWCVMGPVAFGLSRLGAGFADIGLILYGLVEVAGAGLITAYFGGQTTGMIMDPFVNAALVQLVVAGAWFYSGNKAHTEE